jgi:hypothetical protein
MTVKRYLALFAFVACFVNGSLLNFISKTRSPAVVNPPAAAAAAQVPAPIAQPQTKNLEDEFPNLIRDQYRTRFNGAKLPLRYDPWDEGEATADSVDEALVQPLENGEFLVSYGETLFRFDSKQRVVWSHHGPRIFSLAYIKATNLIYATASDNFMLVINAANGKDLFADSRNGSAWYGVAEAYGDDMCLITDNFRGYRDKFRGDRLEPMKDGITCWRGTKKLWHRDFPPDAELVVSGKRILAVTKTDKGIYVNEIAPQANGE